MKNILITMAAVALTSALASTGALAHVAGGALVSGSGEPVKSGDKKCVTAADGTYRTACHIHKRVKAEPAPVAKPVVQNVSLSGDTLFATESAKLNANGEAALDQVAAKAATINASSVKVVGHADSRGEASYNQDLSEKRAATVKSYLTSKGIDADKISASGKGETSPVASNDTAAGRAQNRRVEVNVSGYAK